MVRRLASEAGIDLATVTGSGAGGQIRRQDLYAHGLPRPRLAAVPKPAAPARPTPQAQSPSTTTSATGYGMGADGRTVAPAWLVMENSGVVPTHEPAARQLADELGVRLKSVRGTGDGGRITCSDVRAAAPHRVPAAALPAGFGADGRPVAASTAVVLANSGRTPAHEPAARDLADQLGVRLAEVRGTGHLGRITCSDVRQKVAVDSGEAFDLPPFTASGIPPEALLQVPIVCRRAMAAATTHAEAYRLVTQYSGLDNATARSRLAGDRNVDHQYGGARASW